MLCIEIQKGKKVMRPHAFVDQLCLQTAVTLMGMQKATIADNNEYHNNGCDIFLGNFWFESIETVAQHTLHWCNQNRECPKAYIESTMNTWPDGSHLMMEATVDGVDLLFVGYKYNCKKVNCFIATKGAGHTYAG